jgi:CPA1 family monovalent cation:H+ antiporter
LGLPRRLITILEGESLVNDASALVIYRFAILAAYSGTFFLPAAVGKFFVVGLGGVVTGFLVGRVGLWVLLKLDDVKAQTVMSLVTAFGSYIVGESVGVSGVISTVTGGLVFGRCLPILSTARTRVEAKTSWDLVLFIINGFVFTMIGFQLPTVIENLHAYSWSQLVVYAVVINVTIIAVRFLWVFPATYLPRLFSPSLRKTDPSPKWQSIVVLGWLGISVKIFDDGWQLKANHGEHESVNNKEHQIPTGLCFHPRSRGA